MNFSQTAASCLLTYSCCSSFLRVALWFNEAVVSEALVQCVQAQPQNF